MSTAVAVDMAVQLSAEERALLTGDLSKLNVEQRADLVASVCRSIGVNPLTQPLQYVTLNGKLTLYATKGLTDQLRKIHSISITAIEREIVNDVLFVTVQATDRNGRIDQDMGAVSIAGLCGEGLANAYMKSVTKAKRRVTLSIAGLGLLDESEMDTIPGVVVQEATQARQHMPVKPEPRQITTTHLDKATGEITQAPATPSPEDIEKKQVWKQRQDLLRRIRAYDADYTVTAPTSLAASKAQIAQLQATLATWEINAPAPTHGEGLPVDLLTTQADGEESLASAGV